MLMQYPYSSDIMSGTGGIQKVCQLTPGVHAELIRDTHEPMNARHLRVSTRTLKIWDCDQIGFPKVTIPNIGGRGYFWGHF
jgi:hypothetical protein